MPIEKKDASLPSKVPDRVKTIISLVAKRENQTASEYICDILTAIADKEEQFHISMASQLNLVNVNDISMGYEVNQKKAMYSRSEKTNHLKMVVNN